MNRICALFIVGAVALVGCSKDEKKKEEKKGEPAPKKVTHGKAEGKGSGGGAKTAAGTKDAKAGSGKAVIERGAYLANLGGCAGCHTPMSGMGPDMSKVFGGGMEAHEKMGKLEFTWRGPNITNHETGIKSWSDDEVLAAIREGKHKDGSKLLPIMPYTLYNAMTDDDGKALVAFLRTVPPVDNKVERPKNEGFPAAAYPPVGKPPNLPVSTDPIKKGEYLASIMHCVMCHTPFTDKGPDMSKAWAGGFKMELPPEFGTGVLYSSNITSDPKNGIGKYTEEDVIKAVKTATRPDGKPIMGPMMFYVPMWSVMTDEDSSALAKFIKSIPPNAYKVPKSTFKMGGPPGGGPPGDKPPGDKPPGKKPGKGK